MMCSRERFLKFRGEFDRLLTEGENLREDDESFINSVIGISNPQRILGLIKGLKDEGNDFFKQKKYDEALEKYGYAGLISARYVFDEETSMSECFHLAICLLSNFAACFSKKGEFEHVGRICTFILEFDPKNVKAMFRRAMAAIELGRKDIAYWELMDAIELEPKNKDILGKLQEVEKSVFKTRESNSDGLPVGLGNGLPLPQKSEKKRKVKEVASNKCHEEERVSEFERPCKLPEVDGIQETIEVIKDVDVVMEESLKGATDVVMREGDLHCDLREQNNFVVQQEQVEEGMNKPMMENEFKPNGRGKYEQVKPRYQFSNRRKPGSFLSLSRKDYGRLQQGHSIRCANNKLGLMEIRAVQVSSTQHDKPEGQCDHRNAPVNLVSREEVKGMQPTVVTFTCGVEEKVSTKEVNKKVESSYLGYTSRTKKTRRLRLADAIRKMRTTTTRSSRKKSKGSNLSSEKTTHSATPTYLDDSKIVKTRKRKDSTPPIEQCGRLGKRRLCNPVTFDLNVCIDNKLVDATSAIKVNPACSAIRNEVFAARVPTVSVGKGA